MCIETTRRRRFSSLGGFARVVSLSLSVSVLFSLTNDFALVLGFSTFSII